MMQTDVQVEEVLPEHGDTTSGNVRLSIADALYFLLLFLAALMRLTDLAGIPLSPAEAAEALAIWRYLQPGELPVSIASPAYFTLTTLLASILGDGDAMMRIVPALFGVGLIALPRFIQRQVGVSGALVAAAFLAASPLNSVIARTAGGDAIALFALLLVTVAVVNAHDRPRKQWFYLLAVALGVGFSSSSLFYGGLLALVLSWAITKAVSGHSFWPQRPPAPVMRNALVIGGLTLLALSTRFLTYPAGLGASAQLAAEWLGQFGLAGSLQLTLAPFLLLARYEIALLVLGTAALVWAFWRTTPSRIWLSFWILITFVLMIVQSSEVSNASLVTIPGYLLVGLFSTYLWRSGVKRWTWALTAGLLLIAAILLVNTTRYLRLSAYGQDNSNLWLGVLAIAAALLMIYYFWSLTDASIGQGIWLSAMVLLVLYQWGTAWHLTHRAANDPRERWVSVGTDNDLPVLLHTLKEISRQTTNSDYDLELLSAVDTPVLHWYLRDFRGATIGSTILPQSRHAVILSPAGDTQPSFRADYVGSDFGLLLIEPTEAPPSATPLADLLRWWLFHETAAEALEQRLVLWVRADLALPQQ